MLCIMVIGCQTTDATITTSKELTKNLNLLSNTVKRLDTIDNEYLVSNELYTLETKSVPTQQRTYKNVLAKNTNKIKNIEPSANKINLNDDLRKALSNELVNRIYCDENGNCKLCNEKFICNEDNMCGSCNQTIICDSNGNCTSCGDTLYLDTNNNCKSCKKTCLSNTSNTNISEATKSCLQKISTNNNDIKAELISTNIINDNIVNDINNSDNANISNNSATNSENNNDKNTDNNTSISPSYEFIYFSESFDYPNLQYKPRFINNIN